MCLFNAGLIVETFRQLSTLFNRFVTHDLFDSEVCAFHCEPFETSEPFELLREWNQVNTNVEPAISAQRNRIRISDRDLSQRLPKIINTLTRTYVSQIFVQKLGGERFNDVHLQKDVG